MSSLEEADEQPLTESALGSRPGRSSLQGILVGLFVLALVGVAASGFLLASKARDMDRHDEEVHLRVEEFTDLGVDAADLAAALVALPSGLVDADELRRLHAGAEIRLEGVRGGLMKLDDPTLDRLLVEMDSALGEADVVISGAEADGAADSDASLQASREIAGISHALVDSAAEAATGQVEGKHISDWFLLMMVAMPAGALVVLVALALVINHDLRGRYEETKRRLQLEDGRRRRAERLAIDQAHSMELIASGATQEVISAAVADMVMTETDGRWRVGPNGLTASAPGAGPVSPELASAAARILDLASDRDQILADLVFEASHDGLTRLLNRSAILGHLERLMRRLRDDVSVAVLYMDLNRFKAVNDTYGHNVGDEVLREVANRVETAARRHDLVGRIGGDEFTVVLSPVNLDEARMVAQRIVDSVSRPYRVDGRDISIRVSIGGSFASPDSDPGQVLREADHAMYCAKQVREQVLFADDASREMDQQRHDIKMRLGESFHDGGLTVVYQPLVETATGKLRGVEALARLRMGDRVLPPALFIEVAEDSGQIVQLDRRVLEIASRQVADWNLRFGLDIELAVNLSGAHVCSAEAMADTSAIARSSPLAPELLVMEINEAVFLDDAADVADRIAGIRKTGIRFAIDDFGTGNSSLAYLQILPIDVLKIDRAFIEGLGRSERDDAIVRSIMDLAGALGMEVVAEGVETTEQLEILRDFGCPLSQGYLFAEPAGPETFESRWLSESVKTP